MFAKKIGIITYQTNHLKTEQILEGIIPYGYDIKIYALPFFVREPREVFFKHRPNQSIGANPKFIARKYNLEYQECSSDLHIDNACSLYLVAGCGILSRECLSGKKIINCHPGIIPNSRGLDSFKWAIYYKRPLGITLHYLGNEVDDGEIICVIPTSIYEDDSMEKLARRHYENEIRTFINFEYYVKNPINNFSNLVKNELTKRMNISLEKELYGKVFEEYKNSFK